MPERHEERCVALVVTKKEIGGEGSNQGVRNSILHLVVMCMSVAVVELF